MPLSKQHETFLDGNVGVVGIPGLLLLLLAVPTLLRIVWTKWRAPFTTPLASLRGPEMVHWFFGFLTPREAQSFQMSPKLLDHCQRYGGVWSATFTNRKPTLVLGDLAGVHYVLNESTKYIRAPAQMRVTRLVFGDGLVAVDGAQHRKQRKVLGPAFTTAAVDGMMPVFYDVAQRLVERWRHQLPEEGMLDINAYGESEKLFLDIIGLAGFGYDFKSLLGQRSELEEAFVNVTKSAATGSLYAQLRSQFAFVGVVGQYLSKEQRQLDRHKAQIRALCQRLVHSARMRMTETANLASAEKGQRGRNDIMSLLMRSNLEASGKEAMDEEEVLSVIPTLLSGGYDNNASANAFALYGLARHPQTQLRLREELRHPPPGCTDWQSDPKHLDRLPYLDAVCRETLRLYTSAHSIPRACNADDVIPLGGLVQLRDGTWTDRIAIKRGDDVVIPQKWMNVDPKLWGPDADVFKPERWIQDPKYPHYDGGLAAPIAAMKHSGWSHLMTFSIGPRNCIGYRMAVAQFKVCLAVQLLNFEMLPHPAMDDVYTEVQIVGRPRLKGVDGFCMPCLIRVAT